MNKFPIPVLLSAIGACAILFSCTASGDEPVPVPDPAPSIEEAKPNVPLEITDAEKDIVKKQSNFAIGMLKQLASENSTANFLFSPLSVYSSLSLLAGGAQGDTQTEILSVLGIERNRLDAVNTFNNRLVEELYSADNISKVSLANSIWIDNAFSVNEDYISGHKSKCEIFNADLGTDATRAAVNRWGAAKTDGEIPEILGSWTGADTEMLLMDALSFNSPWGQTFLEKNTSDDYFYCADGSVTRPQMMNADNYKFSAVRDNKLGAFWPSMMLGNHSFQLLIILPDEGVSLKDYLAELTREDYLSLTFDTEDEYYDSYVRFPRFTIDNELDITGIVRELGVSKAFNGSTAEFPLISSGKPGISQVRQKARISFTEKGTDKCTGKGIAVDFGFPAKNGYLIIDRPFAFMIREVWTRTILYIGCVNSLSSRPQSQL